MSAEGHVSRLRIRLLLVIAACVVGAGVATAVIQRSASDPDFVEYADIAGLRIDMLAQAAALEQAVHAPTASSVERFSDARHSFAIGMAKAGARKEEADEEASLARLQRLADRWAKRAELAVAEIVAGPPARADRPDPARAQALEAFLRENAELLADLKAERVTRQRGALLLPIGLVALLTLLSAGLLWVG